MSSNHLQEWLACILARELLAWITRVVRQRPRQSADAAVALPSSENVFNGRVFLDILPVFQRSGRQRLLLLQRRRRLIAATCRRGVASRRFCRTTAAWRRSVAGRACGGLASQLRGVWPPAVWMSVWLRWQNARSSVDLNELCGNLLQ